MLSRPTPPESISSSKPTVFAANCLSGPVQPTFDACSLSYSIFHSRIEPAVHYTAISPSPSPSPLLGPRPIVMSREIQPNAASGSSNRKRKIEETEEEHRQKVTTFEKMKDSWEDA
ncbi:hypothetical protein BX616_004362, partial [Lobosporangium transversale]